jgi:hypothetical protein
VDTDGGHLGSRRVSALPSFSDRLPEHSLELVCGNPGWVTEVDLVVLAHHLISVLRGEFTVHPLQGWPLDLVGTNVKYDTERPSSQVSRVSLDGSYNPFCSCSSLTASMNIDRVIHSGCMIMVV